MKPVKLKPRRGWNYRIILCDDKGNVVCDDRKTMGKAAHKTLDVLFARLLAKKCKVKFDWADVHYCCDEVESISEFDEDNRW